MNQKIIMLSSLNANENLKVDEKEKQKKITSPAPWMQRPLQWKEESMGWVWMAMPLRQWMMGYDRYRQTYHKTQHSKFPKWMLINAVMNESKNKKEQCALDPQKIQEMKDVFERVIKKCQEKDDWMVIVASPWDAQDVRSNDLTGTTVGSLALDPTTRDQALKQRPCIEHFPVQAMGWLNPNDYLKNQENQKLKDQGEHPGNDRDEHHDFQEWNSKMVSSSHSDNLANTLSLEKEKKENESLKSVNSFLDFEKAWDSIQWCTHETLYRLAFEREPATAWEQCKPRSFSWLPVGQACQAQCSFCFSKTSVSDEVKVSDKDLEALAYWASRAQAQGAQRAVITGGGEPTLIPHERLVHALEILKKHYPHVLMISNGAILAKKEKDSIEEILRQWKHAGLTTLALSRHGHDLESDANIMGLKVNHENTIMAAHAVGLPLRWIAVLCKGGIDSPEKIEKYFDRMKEEKVSQVCFKELYVSSLSDNPWAKSKENQFCETHQVPLKMVNETLEKMGFQITAQLPWGAPVWEGLWKGWPLQVAAYTEPSVGWEKTHAQVRSWNALADHRCVASLEDPKSEIQRTDLDTTQKHGSTHRT